MWASGFSLSLDLFEVYLRYQEVCDFNTRLFGSSVSQTFKLLSCLTTDDSLTHGEPSSYTCVDEHTSRCALIGPYF